MAIWARERARATSPQYYVISPPAPPSTQFKGPMIVRAPGGSTPHNVDHDAKITGRKEF